MLKALTAIVALFLCLPAFAGRTADDGIAATWQAARVAIPGEPSGGRAVLGLWRDKTVQGAIKTIPAEVKIPAILFFHGCDGIGVEEESSRFLFLEHGFAVFFPNSFARIGRVANCRTDTHNVSGAPEAHAYRLQEIEYARRQLYDLPWVDQDRVFAIGFSEGGMALAGYSGEGFAGVVVTGWHCFGKGRYFGLRIPNDVPVLTIVGGDDPWYAAKKGRHCGELFDGRTNSRSIVLPGNGHTVLNSPIVENASRARKAILDFLSHSADPTN